MKVIFDIDGTLTDYRTFVKESALPFFVKKYGMKIINDNELEIEDILGMQTFFVEKYSCTEEEAIKMTKKALNEFWVGMEYVKYTLLYPFRNGAAFLGFGWGCTESSTAGCIRSSFETASIGCAGTPMVNVTVSVFDPDDGTEKKYGEEGERCICSPANMMGYFKDEELTQKVLKKHEDGFVWLHTGDLGTISRNGIVTVKGRMTRVLFVFPTAKVYPQLLESEISKVEGVCEVVICGMPDYENKVSRCRFVLLYRRRDIHRKM